MASVRNQHLDQPAPHSILRNLHSIGFHCNKRQGGTGYLISTNEMKIHRISAKNSTSFLYPCNSCACRYSCSLGPFSFLLGHLVSFAYTQSRGLYRVLWSIFCLLPYWVFYFRVHVYTESGVSAAQGNLYSKIRNSICLRPPTFPCIQLFQVVNFRLHNDSGWCRPFNLRWQKSAIVICIEIG